MSASLSPLRAEIDALDAEIIDLLGRRFDVVRRVAVIKQREGLPSVLPDRVEAVKDRAAALGQVQGLDPGFMKTLYQTIIDEACRVEEDFFASCAAATADGARTPSSQREE
ncbi:chorismate mutase [Azospirillum sp. sgz302134]